MLVPMVLLGTALVPTPSSAQSETVIASDDFDRPDETPFATGENWERISGSGTADLTDQRVAGNAGDAVYFWQGAGAFDDARQFARAQVTQASGQVGLVLLGGTDHALIAAWNGGSLFIYWYTGGAIQPALATVASTLQAGDVIEALLDGGTIFAKVNGTVVASVANTTGLTSGRPGFETFQAGGILDDWEGGSPPPGVPMMPPLGAMWLAAALLAAGSVAARGRRLRSG